MASRMSTSPSPRVLALAAVLLAVGAAVPAARADHDAAHPVAADRDRMTLTSSTFLCGSGRFENHGGQMAFWKQTAVIECGNDDRNIENDGFVVADISDPDHPVPVGRFECVATASDIAIWNHLVFAAVDTNNTTEPEPWKLSDPQTSGFGFKGPAGESCTAPVQTRDEAKPDATFQGLRIVSIADRAAPRLVKNVRLNPKGVHNITVLPDLRHVAEDGSPAPRVLAYGSSPGETVHVVEVPLDDPTAARRLYDNDPSTAAPPPPAAFASGCHDITFFVPRKLGVCNNVDAGTRLWDISDPAAPRPIGVRLTSPGRRDHSSALSWDGEMLVVTDEAHDIASPSSCAGNDSSEPVVLWFYDVRNPNEPRVLDTQGPVPVPGGQVCQPKQVSVVPLRSGRDVVAVSWLGGGTTLEEFPTRDGAPARRLGHYFTPLPDSLDPYRTFAFASYWYAGRVYANNVFGCLAGSCFGPRKRGLDVFQMVDAEGRPDPAFADTARQRSFDFGLQECLSPPHGAAHGSLDCPG